ncbi:hypothetical protein CMV_020102 [Castanea mollissima]|uniref:Uncharacterized protein n=1 Tax=Castanea mollissima TaxID=60419 RepID=A0A8J4R1U5_9ROSI|nr:hypothetical protein CMV_020102 [Castanea mollissima]
MMVILTWLQKWESDCTNKAEKVMLVTSCVNLMMSIYFIVPHHILCHGVGNKFENATITSDLNLVLECFLLLRLYYKNKPYSSTRNHSY